MKKAGEPVLKAFVDANGIVVAAADMDDKPLQVDPLSGGSIIGASLVQLEEPATTDQSITQTTQAATADTAVVSTDLTGTVSATAVRCIWKLIHGVWTCV